MGIAAVRHFATSDCTAALASSTDAAIANTLIAKYFVDSLVTKLAWV